MKTQVKLGQKLIKTAMRLSGCNTQQQVVELALRNLIAYHRRHNIKDLFGKVSWEGNLSEMREAK